MCLFLQLLEAKQTVYTRSPASISNLLLNVLNFMYRACTCGISFRYRHFGLTQHRLPCHLCWVFYKIYRQSFRARSFIIFLFFLILFNIIIMNKKCVIFHLNFFDILFCFYNLFVLQSNQYHLFVFRSYANG